VPAFQGQQKRDSPVAGSLDLQGHSMIQLFLILWFVATVLAMVRFLTK